MHSLKRGDTMNPVAETFYMIGAVPNLRGLGFILAQLLKISGVKAQTGVSVLVINELVSSTPCYIIPGNPDTGKIRADIHPFGLSRRQQKWFWITRGIKFRKNTHFKGVPDCSADKSSCRMHLNLTSLGAYCPKWR
jgi:hypothetical protein